MSEYYTQLADQIARRFKAQIISVYVEHGEVTVEVAPQNLINVCTALRDEVAFYCEELIDVCGVDYLGYGDKGDGVSHWDKGRFASVYQLLSLKHNHRIRVKTYVDGEPPILPSVVNIWASANWFERESFDLYGIIYEGHPDLRRILTDYGFVGHPFRKDFPLSGHVEMRYDTEKQRVVYQPVSIEPRINQPRVIRDDHRYSDRMNQEEHEDA